MWKYDDVGFTRLVSDRIQCGWISSIADMCKQLDQSHHTRIDDDSLYLLKQYFINRAPTLKRIVVTDCYKNDCFRDDMVHITLRFNSGNSLMFVCSYVDKSNSCLTLNDVKF